MLAEQTGANYRVVEYFAFIHDLGRLNDNHDPEHGYRAALIGEKIAALGGVPVATRNEIKQSRDLQEVMEFSLAFESKAVEMYSKAIDMAEGDKALVIFLEDILKEEQDGVDEYTKLLRSSTGAAGSNPALKTG